MTDSLRTSTRATSPVVGKAMEATLVVLYLGLVTTALYGGAVDGYRGAAGAEVADRTLADLSTDVERAIPPATTAATVRIETELPPTIAGTAYRVRAGPDELVLEHPDPRVATTAPLVLPDRVVAVSGTWESGDEATLRVESVEDGLEVRLA
ncbi:DUF7266 family protein [Natronomonas marina]|uniref:DUF7266 family protein n=1 Tax=Natronomonas marina TaxID=2961939 RepID=UPI0020C9AEBC|nr:hypothetical protein [Natronomonas marina]